MAKKLYRFYSYYGRMGELEGLFVYDEEIIQKAIGKTAYLGEVLGKHSDVCYEIDAKDFTVLTDDIDFINKALEYGLLPVGTNPIDAYLCDTCEEEDEDDEE